MSIKNYLSPLDDIHRIVREELYQHDLRVLRGILRVESILTLIPPLLYFSTYLLWYYKPSWWTRYLYSVMEEYRGTLMVINLFGMITINSTLYMMRAVR